MPTQPAVTQPYDEEAERLAADDVDTIAEVKPLPEQPQERSGGKPEAMPSIGFIGRYALKYVIGEGGLGTVYAAHDPLLSRLTAIKTLHTDLPVADREQFNAMVLNEAKAAGSLNHPHIVTIYDAGTSEQGTYIAMELLRGKDLRQLQAMGWKPTAAQSALIVRRVADALSYAHHKGVIHRDIKPANIFMVGRTQPRVLDFGIARVRQTGPLASRDDPQSRFQEIVGGSPYYMAPEQVLQQAIDRRVDVYALGVVLYELLVHRRAFEGGSLEDIADAVLHKPVPPAHEVNPEVPKALSEIAARAMHRDPEQRTRSARRLSLELREWLHTVEDPSEPVPVRTRRAGIGRHRGLWAMAAVGWLAAAVGVGWYVWSHAHAARSVAVSSVQTPQSLRPATPQARLPAPAPAAMAPASIAVGAASPAASVASAATSPVGASMPAKQALAAEAVASPGVVHLAINPWGEVLVDGRSVGVSPPMRQFHLAPGQHVVLVRNGASPPYRQTIEVRSGKAVRVAHDF